MVARNRLKDLDPGKKRKLLKTPVMTLAYNVKDDGMMRQMSEVYAELFDGNEPTPQAARYLAKKVRKACEKLVPGPVAVMRYVTALTRECNTRDCFLEWTTPTGFPVSNRYNQEKFKTINLVRHGERIRHRFAVELPKIDKTGTTNSAPANFIHSLDASHLVRVVNAAMDEGIGRDRLRP